MTTRTIPPLDISTLDDDALLTDVEAAAAFRLNAGVMRNWRHQGRGPAFVRHGRKVAYQIRAVRQFLASHTVDPAQPEND